MPCGSGDVKANEPAGEDSGKLESQTGSFRVHGIDERVVAPASLRRGTVVPRVAAVQRHAQASHEQLLQQLATASAYTKRNVAQECETLELAAFVEIDPLVRPDWRALFTVVTSLMSPEHAVPPIRRARGLCGRMCGSHPSKRER